MANEVRLVYPDGRPIPPQKVAGNGRRRPLALTGGGGYGSPPYDAANVTDQHMSAWTPYLWSPDAETNIYRDRIVSRVRDLVRNDGWASGAVTRILDNAIGANLRPIPKPDHRFLANDTGNKGYDLVWAKEWASVCDSNWRSWASEDTGNWCDASRNQDFSDLMRTAFRHKLVDGDALAVMQWMPERQSRGRARYATAVQLVDPDRLSNPQLRFDDQTMRGGVAVDGFGAATGYWIRRAHQGDWFSAAESMSWDLLPRETQWGRPIVIHDFDLERAGTHRGGGGIFLPVVQRLKMLIKYDGVELDSAILNSIFASYVQSPFDPQLMGEALADGEVNLNGYQATRREFHQQNDIMVGNARIPVLFPGEEIKTTQAAHPHGNFPEFESAILRNVATATGLSAQQLSNDWGDVNYSSARGALLEAWKTLERRRHQFSRGFAGKARACWLEESIEEDKYPWPGNKKPDFATYRGALSKCRWLGPALGWLDPVAEVQASVMRMDAGLGTLEDEAAVQGMEWEETLEQRKFELDKFDELGIPRPAWAGQMIVEGENKGLKPMPKQDGDSANPEGGEAPREGQPGAKPQKATPEKATRLELSR